MPVNHSIPIFYILLIFVCCGRYSKLLTQPFHSASTSSDTLIFFKGSNMPRLGDESQLSVGQHFSTEALLTSLLLLGMLV